MNWIKYQIVCGTNENGENVLLNKKVGYNAENLAIAEAEAYDGFEIVYDADGGQSFEKEPLTIELGGTGAKTSEGAVKNLGAIPFGKYGLGQNNIVHTIQPDGSDIVPEVKASNDIGHVGWHTVDDIFIDNGGDVISLGICAIRMDSNSVQTAYWINERNNVCTLHRSKDIYGVWKPWEWENPPMHAGVQYRTTERYLGHSVYKKHIYLGILPDGSGGQVSIPHGIDTKKYRLISFDAYARGADVEGQNVGIVQSIPLVNTTGEVTCKVMLTSEHVRLYTFANLSSYMAYITICYIEEDTVEPDVDG